MAIVERFQISEVALDIKGLHFQYSSKKDAKPALNGLTFQTKKGNITGILGPNGSGKSTCFKLVATQLKLQGGLVHVMGEKLKANEAAVRKKLGICFQSPSLDPLLSVMENLQIQAALYGMDSETALLEILKMLKLFNCEEWAQKKCSQLSGGQARRVEIIKSLLHTPEILLLDEPSNGLDPEMRRDLWEELKHVQKLGVSVHVTTHLMEEAEFCDDLIIVNEGQCVGAGSPEELKEELGYELIYLTFPGDNDYLGEVNQLVGTLGKTTMNRGMIRIESQKPEECFSLVKNKWKDQLKKVSWEKPSIGDVYLSKAGKELRLS